MDRILVSACLMGATVRWNGTAKVVGHPALGRWQAEGRLVSFCPEVAVGFAVPRPPAEIEGGASGGDVLAGRARVIERGAGGDHRDVTAQFHQAAEMTLALALSTGCRYAILTEGSPSCGSTAIHDGGFAGRVHPGQGVTAACLRANGIAVFSEDGIDDLAAMIV